MSDPAVQPLTAPGDGAVLRRILYEAGRLIVGKPDELRLALT